jgi:hypothetical protein
VKLAASQRERFSKFLDFVGQRLDPLDSKLRVPLVTPALRPDLGPEGVDLRRKRGGVEPLLRAGLAGAYLSVGGRRGVVSRP